MDFKFEVVKKRNIRNPVLIEGLPGIGNVGKIAVDFIADSIMAERFMTIVSNHLPHSVFVNERNLVDLPKIELYHKKVRGKDLVFLTGDVQPIDEPSCYSFCENLLNHLHKWKTELVITTGGIGLQTIPKKPVVYITGNSPRMIKTFNRCDRKIYGVVGPVIGVTGLLVGLAEKRRIPAVALLAQTFGHPAYIGMKGAKEIINVLNERLGLKVRTEMLDKDIAELEKEIKAKTQPFADLGKVKNHRTKAMDYFG